MSDIVEKQDVDISKLFEWGRVFEVIDPNDETREALVFMKLLGDADIGRARVYALRQSAELRRKLRDLNSDERIAWIRDIDELTKDDLVNLILLFSGREISINAKNKTRVPTPKSPKSTAKLPTLEEHQAKVDEYPKKRQEAIAKAIEKEIETLRSKLQERDKEDLYREYVKNAVDEFCERMAITAFEDMSTYLGCYEDETYKPDKRFFKSFDEFDNLPPETKANFKDAFRSLDIELPELKKLRRATP